jgi:hypothetical protein
MHAHTLKLHTGGQHAVVVHPVHRSPAAHARVYIIYMYIYGSPIHHVGFCCCCCCCSLLLPLGLMMLHPRAYVFYYVPAYYYSIILRRYSGSTSSSRRVVAGGGGWRRRRRPVWCVRLYCIHNIYVYIHVCVCGVGLGGRASELQRTSGGHRIKCALRNRSLCL